MKIGVTLSGGGIRATVFHLGVFRYLAERGFLSQVSRVSSVSGASLCVALIFAKNGNKWPSDQEYLEKVLPDITETIRHNNIQKAALFRLPFSPRYWGNKAALIAQVMREKWGVTGSLRDLPAVPRWDINCTTFETGKNFRFNKGRMGDYRIGYVENPDFPIADAAAASAGFPILIGPLKLKAGNYSWTGEPEKPRESIYYLWDGGVYDNLGLEALYKPDQGLSPETDFLIVSNASASSGYLHRNGWSSAKNLKRLLDIALDQVASLRSREIVSAVMKRNQGLFINIGNSAEKIAGNSQVDPETKKQLVDSCMSPEEALKVRQYATTLSSPSQADYERILRHGYENAKCSYVCYDRA